MKDDLSDAASEHPLSRVASDGDAHARGVQSGEVLRAVHQGGRTIQWPVRIAACPFYLAGTQTLKNKRERSHVPFATSSTDGAKMRSFVE